jgi:hypothetical protein
LLDSGQFGSVAIAPDANHVAYQGVDEITKDRPSVMKTAAAAMRIQSVARDAVVASQRRLFTGHT